MSVALSSYSFDRCRLFRYPVRIARTAGRKRPPFLVHSVFSGRTFYGNHEGHHPEPAAAGAGRLHGAGPVPVSYTHLAHNDSFLFSMAGPPEKPPAAGNFSVSYCIIPGKRLQCRGGTVWNDLRCRRASSLAGPSQSKPCGFASSPERGSFIRADLQKTSSPPRGSWRTQ